MFQIIFQCITISSIIFSFILNRIYPTSDFAKTLINIYIMFSPIIFPNDSLSNIFLFFTLLEMGTSFIRWIVNMYKGQQTSKKNYQSWIREFNKRQTEIMDLFNELEEITYRTDDPDLFEISSSSGISSISSNPFSISEGEEEQENERNELRTIFGKIFFNNEIDYYIQLGDKLRFGGYIDGIFYRPSPILARLFYERCLNLTSNQDLKAICIDRLATLNELQIGHIPQPLIDIISCMHINQNERALPRDIYDENELASINLFSPPSSEDENEDEEIEITLGDEEGRILFDITSETSEDEYRNRNEEDDYDDTKSELELNDDENVHSHGFQASLCEAVDFLRGRFGSKLYDHTAIARSCKYIYEQIQEVTYLDQRKKENTLDTLQYIRSQEGDLLHERQRITEKEALVLVWLRLEELYPNLIRDQLEAIVQSLSENVNPDDGEQYCPTGRLSRIIAILDGIDPEVNLKTSWSINRELNDLVPHLRDEYLNTQISSESKEIYLSYTRWNSPIETDVDRFVHNIHNYLIAYIKRECEDRYKHTSPEILNQWLRPYIEAL